MKTLIIFLTGFTLLFTNLAFSQNDEFKPFTEDSANVSNDEFTEFNEDTASVACDHNCATCLYANQEQNNQSIDFSWGSTMMITIIAFSLTLLAGILVRYRKTRNLRIIFLLIGLGFFGFYNGACPCMISSFENTILFIRGVEIDWTSMLWFLGLIPLTYIFGRVWCGWVCHMGALQEFLFRPKGMAWLQSEKTAYYLKIIRYVLLAALVIQLLIMGEIFWCKIDPFKAIFNINLNYNYEILSAILVALLLVTSIFSYRPFCRTVCPIGITLGWISAIPGASILGYKKSACTSCKNCNDSCEINAIIRRKRTSYLDNKECIACGNCIDNCPNYGIHFKRKNKINPVIVF
ncbi:MAG: 4Fe-4S binding protein, partial [Bacteroidales bacterium]